MDDKNRKTTSILPVQHFCSVCSYRVSAVWALPSNNNKKVPANLQVLASPWLLVTPPKTPLQRFYLLLQPPLFSPSFPSPSELAHEIKSPQGPSAKHKNSLFVSLLLQIGSTQGEHFHALCLLQLFKRSLYARKHKLIHKPTGHFMTKEMEIESFRGNVWVLRHAKAHLTQL